MNEKEIRNHIRTVWNNIKNRCFDPTNRQFKCYGGRGIFLCEFWYNFENFFNDMRPNYIPGLEIERIDNDGPYSPENCKWTDEIRQARNKRNNHIIEFKGEALAMAEWAERVGLPYTTLITRINKYGWDIARALTTPRIGNENVGKPRLITHNGVTKNITEWSRITGIGITTICYRINAGYPPEKLFGPSRNRHKRGHQSSMSFPGW